MTDRPDNLVGQQVDGTHPLTSTSTCKREQQIAALACMNYTNRQIAAHLFISPETVKTHMRNVLRKFDLHSKAELRQTLGDWDFSSWAELVE